MSRDFDSIKDITDAKELWKLAVRIEDLWKMGVGKGEHLEFLILDKQGDNIQVLLPPDLCPLWSPTLHEGNVYIMKNFKVQPNDFKVKLSDHPFMMVVVGGEGGSHIVPAKMTNLPHYSLKFKPFEEIKSGNYRNDLLVDVIGVVHDVAPPKMKIGSKKIPTTFSLADAAMNIITCTLWDKFGSDFLEQYNALGGTAPIIVMLKHANIKEPQGNYDLTVSNAWVGTKLMMDQDLPEIKDFIKSLPQDYVSLISQSQTQSITPAGLGFNSQGSQYSTGTRYAYLAPPTHLRQLTTLPEEEIVTTVGTPHHVCVSRNGWYYLACSECGKGIVNNNVPYKCKIDSHVTPNPLIKYRVEVEVRFGDDKCKFLFWDRECSQLIRKSAAEVQAIMTQAGEFDPREYPKILDDMLGTQLVAFKVKMQSNGKIASVLNYRSDPKIIEHLLGEINNDESPKKLFLMPSGGPSSAPSGGESSNKVDDLIPGLSQDTNIPTQDLSATAESDPDEVKMKTPAKRPVAEPSQDDASAGKLSSNKVPTIRIKKERGVGNRH